MGIRRFIVWPHAPKREPCALCSGRPEGGRDTWCLHKFHISLVLAVISALALAGSMSASGLTDGRRASHRTQAVKYGVAAGATAAMIVYMVTGVPWDA